MDIFTACEFVIKAWLEIVSHYRVRAVYMSQSLGKVNFPQCKTINLFCLHEASINSHSSVDMEVHILEDVKLFTNYKHADF